MHVADLVLGAEVLHHLVRGQHVGADLAPPGDVALLARERLELASPLLARLLGQLGREDLHGAGLVLVLAALVLTGHDGSGGQMGDPHGRVGDVDVLASRAR